MINLESNKEIIPFKTKINFSLGALATGFFSGFPFGSLTLFYEEKLGANHELIGLAWLIFMIWNTVNDPIASFIIDNTRTKIGRRIPYIRFGSFFYGAAFIFCWIPIAQIGDEWGLFWNFLVALFLLDTMYTIVGCCFFSLPNEIAVTSQGRVNIGLFSSAIMVINTVLGFILPMIYLSGDSIGEGFQEMMIILGIIFTLVMFFSSFGIKENLFAQMQEYEPFFEGIKLTFKNKPFWVFMVPAFFFALVIPLISTSFIYYMDYVLKDQNSFLFIIGMLVGIIIGVRFFLKKLPEWKTRKTIIFGLYILSLGFFLILFLGFNAYLAIIPYSIIGFGAAGVLVIYPVVMGDLIDNDELITGKRREAIYGGVNAIVTKPSLSIANWVFLVIIYGFGFLQPIFNESGESIQQSQNDSALFGVLFAMSVIPAIGLFISAIVMRWYSLDGPEWEQEKYKILELHKKKEQEYLQKLSEDKNSI